MAPTPQEHVQNECGDVQQTTASPSQDGENVVISGMSGLYPESSHVDDLSKILYEKINPVTADNVRWIYNHPEVTDCSGKIPTMSRFDAQFFKVHYKLALTMDPMARKILEQCYQAIYDAGLNPEHLSGKKVGVYVGSGFSESEKVGFYAAISKFGFGIPGCSKSMFANRISYWLNTKGPSIAVDQACCSSLVALEMAYHAIKTGQIESALVGGSNLCLHPHASVHYGRVMPMCKDGKMRSFDQNASGCVRSEAINVLFLQKAKNALRVYADLVHVKCEYSTMLDNELGPKFGFYRNEQKLSTFLKSFYEEAKVSPDAVEYVEAFGSAVPEADKTELDAISNVFCSNRKTALPVGSVSSNVGFTEAASGITSITKVLLGYQRGEIAGNLHYEKPREDVAALHDGRMFVTTDHHPFDRTYVAVNSISFTGSNAHVLLHGNYKPKDIARYKANIPYLVFASGRHEPAVEKIINHLKSSPVDTEEIALLHNIHETSIAGHMCRGYITIDNSEGEKTEVLHEKVGYYDDSRRQLWFVYSGMGSQWPEMGAQLMRIPVFAAAIERCDQVLKPKGIDIINIITSMDKTIFDNILHSFVGIAAVQIGLTDILRELEIVPDNIIGHSVGELGCAYADGCMTAEEMILAAYSRGLVSVQTPFIRGSMAAVGLGYRKVISMCPPDIEVACHNGPDSCTISGPADSMRDFVAQLTEKGIFAKEVQCSNIAYHSRYIAEAGPGLLKYLQEVIKTPRPRSKRWLSTSVPQEKWEEPIAQYSSAEYHTNNLLNPVLFEETSRLIPYNAIVIEIAPHGLLQAILKRSLPESCKNIPLTRRGYADNAVFLLDAIGKLYMEGLNPKISALYPKIEFPVSTGTPSLSNLVEWSHSEVWRIPMYPAPERKKSGRRNYIISLQDKENSYLKGHCIKNTINYPYAAALVAVWDTLAMLKDVPPKKLSVKFRDLHFHSQPVMQEHKNLKLNVALLWGTGSFEVTTAGESKVVTGIIREAEFTDDLEEIEHKSEKLLNSSDIYQLLQCSSFSYSGEFRSIQSADITLSEAFLLWNENWVTLIDGILQLNLLRKAHNNLPEVTRIRGVSIDVDRHDKFAIEVEEKRVLPVTVIPELDCTRCGGIVVDNIKYSNLSINYDEEIAVKALTFIPNICSNKMEYSLNLLMQIVAENEKKDKINALDLRCETANIPKKFDVTSDIEVDYNTANIKDLNLETVLSTLKEVDVILVNNLSSNDGLCQTLFRELRSNTFIINDEDGTQKTFRTLPVTLYSVLCVHGRDTGARLELARWKPIDSCSNTTALTVTRPSDLSLLTSTKQMLPPNSRLLIFAPYPPLPGLKSLIQTWRRDKNGIDVQLIMNTNDEITEIPKTELAFMAFNQGKWGGYYYLPYTQEISQSETGLTLHCAEIGNLKSLEWIKKPNSTCKGINVKVHYAGINKVDVEIATRVMPNVQNEASDVHFGMDFSGVTESGERVMGILRTGAISTHVCADPELLWPVPDHWSLEEAATVPLAYLQALYCFSERFFETELMHSDSRQVLVHGGAGALGQAIINVAHAFGLTVFTTVSDRRKKEFLKKLFPELKDVHIGYSRDQNFCNTVINETNGKGCFVVISGSNSDLKTASLDCISVGGIMLDVSQLKSQEQFELPMFSLTNNRSYYAIDFSSLFDKNNVEFMKSLHSDIAKGIQLGYVRPLSMIKYSPDEVSRAFGLISTSRHRGRVLLELKDGLRQTQPRLKISADKCQLLIINGDLFGLQVVDNLIDRGARNIHINTAQNTAPLQYKIRLWTDLGVQVVVSSEDLCHIDETQKLLQDISNKIDIESIFIIATELKESNYDYNSFSQNIDSASRRLCPNLKYFVTVCNSEGVDEYTSLARVRNNLPATSLKLQKLRKQEDTLKTGMSWHSALKAIEQGIFSNQPVVSATSYRLPKPSLFQQLAVITGVDIPLAFDENITLKDLGVAEDNYEAVAAFLRINYNVAFTVKQISTLTMKRFKEVEESMSEANYEKIKGLKLFFSNVVSDELEANQDFMLMSTLTSNIAMRLDEFDGNLTYMYIIPGLEGIYEKFNCLCEPLKISAFVLQPGVDRINESLSELAERYVQILLKKTKLKDEFYLLGYESGVAVAMKVAATLESLGYTGTVFCIGHTPEEFKLILNEELSEYKSEEQLWNAVMKHMLTLMFDKDCSAIEDVRQGATDWRIKIPESLRNLLDAVPHSAQYARALIESAYSRILQTRDYKLQPLQLRSQLVMIRPAGYDFNADYQSNFEKNFINPVKLYQLNTHMPHILDDPRCSIIINENLSQYIREEYDNQNRCETYLTNAETLMSSVDIVLKPNV